MSEEDFSLVLEPSEDTLEGLKALIENKKRVFEQLEEHQKELESSVTDAQDLTEQFRDRARILQQDLDQDRRRYMDQVAQDQEKLRLLQVEEAEMRQELERVKLQLQEAEDKTQKLQAQADVFSAAPEKNVVLKKDTGSFQKGPGFDITSQILYPMEGGTALLTFDEAAVAQTIVTMRKHRVDLGGEFHVNVEARWVPVILPKTVEIDAQVCPRRILILDLPQIDCATLQDKLFIHFSIRKHGGGEVEQCEVLPESGTAVVTFADKNISQALTEKKFHDVMLPNGPHRVRVSAFVNGNVTNLETRTKLCSRTVLLTGIPDIADAETLQDLLEIHFQKIGNGGGEISAVLYCPEGQTRTALFQKPPANG